MNINSIVKASNKLDFFKRLIGGSLYVIAAMSPGLYLSQTPIHQLSVLSFIALFALQVAVVVYTIFKLTDYNKNSLIHGGYSKASIDFLFLKAYQSRLKKDNALLKTFLYDNACKLNPKAKEKVYKTIHNYAVLEDSQEAIKMIEKMYLNNSYLGRLLVKKQYTMLSSSNNLLDINKKIIKDITSSAEWDEVEWQRYKAKKSMPIATKELGIYDWVLISTNDSLIDEQKQRNSNTNLSHFHSLVLNKKTASSGDYKELEKAIKDLPEQTFSLISKYKDVLLSFFDTEKLKNLIASTYVGYSNEYKVLINDIKDFQKVSVASNFSQPLTQSSPHPIEKNSALLNLKSIDYEPFDNKPLWQDIKTEYSKLYQNCAALSAQDIYEINAKTKTILPLLMMADEQLHQQTQSLNGNTNNIRPTQLLLRENMSLYLSILNSYNLKFNEKLEKDLKVGNNYLKMASK